MGGQAPAQQTEEMAEIKKMTGQIWHLFVPYTLKQSISDVYIAAVYLSDLKLSPYGPCNIWSFFFGPASLPETPMLYAAPCTKPPTFHYAQSAVSVINFSLVWAIITLACPFSLMLPLSPSPCICIPPHLATPPSFLQRHRFHAEGDSCVYSHLWGKKKHANKQQLASCWHGE